MSTWKLSTRINTAGNSEASLTLQRWKQSLCSSIHTHFMDHVPSYLYQNSYWTMSCGLQKRVYFRTCLLSLCPQIKQNQTQVLLPVVFWDKHIWLSHLEKQWFPTHENQPDPLLLRRSWWSRLPWFWVLWWSYSLRGRETELRIQYFLFPSGNYSRGIRGSVIFGKGFEESRMTMWRKGSPITQGGCRHCSETQEKAVPRQGRGDEISASSSESHGPGIRKSRIGFSCMRHDRRGLAPFFI